MANNCQFCEYRSPAEDKLSAEELQLLSPNCLTVKFKKGDVIIRQGNFSTNVAYLKKGLVKIHIDGPYHVQVVRIVKPKNYLGLPTTFGDKINQYSVTAIDECEVCFIDITTFRKMLETNSAFTNQIIIELCTSELESYQKCVNRTQKQTHGKLADVLLEFANVIFKSDQFTLNITQEEIGNLVDASRESVSRVFTEFGKEGIIEMKGKSVKILDKNALISISKNG